MVEMIEVEIKIKLSDNPDELSKIVSLIMSKKWLVLLIGMIIYISIQNLIYINQAIP